MNCKTVAYFQERHIESFTRATQVYNRLLINENVRTTILRSLLNNSQIRTYIFIYKNQNKAVHLAPQGTLIIIFCSYCNFFSIS